MSSASGLGGKEGPSAFSVDLAAAARRLLAFLRAAPAGVGPRSVWRYEELWMPLAAGEAGGGGEAAMLLPPPDVHLVWLCHCFHHESYSAYCMSRFGRLINRPSILDVENEVYAEDRCRDVWAIHFQSEPFDLDTNEIDGNCVDNITCDSVNGEIVKMVRWYAGLADRFASPFVWEGVYHVAARRRYVRFLDLIKKVVCATQECTRLVPSLDILLMWLAHQVYVFLKGEFDKEPTSKEFLRLRTQRCHRSLKLNKSISNLSCKSWQKVWHLYCEFATRGLLIEFRRTLSGCFRKSKFLKNISFSWSDVLHEKALALTEELDVRMRAMASITPPVQAPYLLKCVPDRVTDDGGAMISDVILRMRNYRPQEGRWLTRTVLDHSGRECFVIRMRVGRGIWRRGAETPMAVKWEDRSIEVREGSWSYIASTSSVGYAPEKIVGTATVMKDQQENKVVWSLSTGDTLTVCLGDELSFQLTKNSSDEEARLLVGRRLSYRVNTDNASSNLVEEEQYLTLVRKSPDHHGDRATMLLNWKLLAVEFLPEEDAVFVLLLCMVIARTMTEIRREDVAGLLVRRRISEARAGQTDWGSVMLPGSLSPDPHLQPWYRNAAQVLSSAETGPMLAKYSPADGKDMLYRQALIPKS